MSPLRTAPGERHLGTYSENHKAPLGAVRDPCAGRVRRHREEGKREEVWASPNDQLQQPIHTA